MTTLSKSISCGVHVGFQWCMYSRQVSVCIVHLRMHKERNHEPSIDSSSFTDSLDILCWPDWCSTIGRVKVRHQALRRIEPMVSVWIGPFSCFLANAGPVCRSCSPLRHEQLCAPCVNCSLVIGLIAASSASGHGWSNSSTLLSKNHHEPWAKNWKGGWQIPFVINYPASYLGIWQSFQSALGQFFPLSWMLHLFLLLFNLLYGWLGLKFHWCLLGF